MSITVRQWRRLKRRYARRRWRKRKVELLKKRVAQAKGAPQERAVLFLWGLAAFFLLMFGVALLRGDSSITKVLLVAGAAAFGILACMVNWYGELRVRPSGKLVKTRF